MVPSPKFAPIRCINTGTVKIHEHARVPKPSRRDPIGVPRFRRGSFGCGDVAANFIDKPPHEPRAKSIRATRPHPDARGGGCGDKPPPRNDSLLLQIVPKLDPVLRCDDRSCASEQLARSKNPPLFYDQGCSRP